MPNVANWALVPRHRSPGSPFFLVHTGLGVTVFEFALMLMLAASDKLLKPADRLPHFLCRKPKQPVHMVHLVFGERSILRKAAIKRASGAVQQRECIKQGFPLLDCCGQHSIAGRLVYSHRSCHFDLLNRVGVRGQALFHQHLPPPTAGLQRLQCRRSAGEFECWSGGLELDDLGAFA